MRRVHISSEGTEVWLDDNGYNYTKTGTGPFKIVLTAPEDFLNRKEEESIPQYIDRLHRHIIDVECSNRGHLSRFNSDQGQIKRLKWILENAVAMEEKHYESENTIPGWLAEAKEIILMK